jgi:hypothetical protein
MKKKVWLSADGMMRLRAWLEAYCPSRLLRDPEFQRGLLFIVNEEIRVSVQADRARRWPGRFTAATRN